MYFFIEQKDELIRDLNKALSEDEFGVVEEVWDNTNKSLYEKYSMPAIHLYEDGYNRGDATDEELIALAVRVKEDGWKDCYYNDEDDEALFKSLDREFISVFEEKVKAEISKRSE